MQKKETKLISFLLFIIIIFSGILIYKINKTPKYDEKLYEEIYGEYENVISNNSSNIENINDIEYKEESNSNNITEATMYNRIIGTISIPKINVFYPIIHETTEELLKIAPTKLWGPNPNEVGNLCITAHNYKNEEYFSNLKKLEVGDVVKISNTKNVELTYKVFDKYEVYPDDLSCTSQLTNGNIEATLITCAQDRQKRLVVKCLAIN